MARAITNREGRPTPGLMKYTVPAQRSAFHLVAFGCAFYLMLSIAILNGYPLFYPDSVDYLWNSATFQAPVQRSVIYCYFIRFASFGMSPWLVVFAQAVITIFVLYTVNEYILRQHRPSQWQSLIFLGLIGFLVSGTSLPWFAGQLMPDVFTGLSFLCVFLLLYDCGLSLDRKLLVSVILGIATGSHLSHFAALGLFLSAVVVLRAFKAGRFSRVTSLREIAVFVLVPMLVAAGIVAASNRRSGHGFRLLVGTPMFLLGRLMESGLAGDYLAKQCRVEQLTPCKYLGRLPTRADAFLWHEHPLFKEMGGWLGGEDEARKIVIGTIQHSPIRFTVECVKQMFLQFVMFEPGDGNDRVQPGSALIDSLYPGDALRYRLTRQWFGSLTEDARKISPLYTAVFWGSLIVSFVALLKFISRDLPAHSLFVLTLVFLFANALVTAAISGTHDRYQCRVAWLMAVSCAAYLMPLVLCWWNERAGRSS